MSYIALNDMINDLGMFEFEIYVTTPSNNTGYSVADTLTGNTSSATMVVSRVISATRYAVNTVSAEFTLGETITNGSVTAKLLTSDANFVQKAINRAVATYEDITNDEALNTSTTVTQTFRTKVGTHEVFLDFTPVISITSITIGGDAYTGTEGVDEEYVVNKHAGIINFHTGDISVDSDVENLSITYTYGDASISVSNLSASTKSIIVDMVQYMYAKWYRTVIANGASSVNPGSFAMSFQNEELFTEDMKKRLAYKTKWLFD